MPSAYALYFVRLNGAAYYVNWVDWLFMWFLFLQIGIFIAVIACKVHYKFCSNCFRKNVCLTIRKWDKLVNLHINVPKINHNMYKESFINFMSEILARFVWLILDFIFRLFHVWSVSSWGDGRRWYFISTDVAFYRVNSCCWPGSGTLNTSFPVL